jgi:hypothetical protein
MDNGDMAWLIWLLVEAQSVDLGDIPFEWVTGPVALTAYLLWDNHRKDKKITALELKNDELDKESRDMAKAAISALKKAGERE